MAMDSAPSIPARLYLAQHATLWHPLRWPDVVARAPGRAAASVQSTVANADVAQDNSFQQHCRRGAARLVGSTVAYALAVPPALLLTGTVAPLAAVAGAHAAALLVGTGTNSPPFGSEKDVAQSTPGPSHAMACIARYGVLGCATELLAAKLGMLGAAWGQDVNSTQATQAAAWAFERLGYGAALCFGALLTVARLGVALTLATAHGLTLAIAAGAGAALGAASYLVHKLQGLRPTVAPGGSDATSPSP